MTDTDRIGFESPSFALTVSDLLVGAKLEERIDDIASAARLCGHLRFILVRDDAMDADLLVRAVEAADEAELELIVESPVLDNLAATARSLWPKRPMLVSPGDGLLELGSRLGLPVAVPFSDPSEAGRKSAEALEAGCEAVLLADVPNMKGVLECTVGALRSSNLPVACRAWSGEYALSVASVGALRGTSLAILDDLDPDACMVLNELMDGLAGTGFEPPRRCTYQRI